VAKSPLIKFVYNNNVYSTTSVNPFFAIYGFYLNIPLSIKDDRLKKEISIARKKAEEFKREGKKLAKR
jgi:hypothetical protein